MLTYIFQILDLEISISGNLEICGEFRNPHPFLINSDTYGHGP